jgi:hypothetical protein
LGDEITKFFHANGTVKHNRNFIRSPKNSKDVVHFQHEEKAHILWEAFKDRLGQSEFTEIFFDLQTLLQPIDELDDLVNLFTTEEIDGIIKELKSDKSPGPDGFNTDFMK